MSTTNRVVVQFEIHRLESELSLWETYFMANDERSLEELLIHAKELQRTAERLIQQSKILMEEYEKGSGKPKRKREDFSRTAAPIVKEATERN